MRYWQGDKEKALSVGVYPKVTLGQARKKAEEVRAQIQAGDDPSKVRKDTAIKKKVAAENTFEVIARGWYAKQAHTWAASHAVDVKRRLESNIYLRGLRQCLPQRRRANLTIHRHSTLAPWNETAAIHQDGEIAQSRHHSGRRIAMLRQCQSSQEIRRSAYGARP
ncbi:Arm DNA-binding domain-containing protein [Pararobbsia alpina]|uniref:Integrase DNA-binding domain-containing protein n=1 Tax=Pararobbsia alpina TaxID=621374 RepID=A0A6S7B269_9BURK|nr:Arm DNA-binding domain-containing protein [Pararobbsia alpina]CAB3775818.1 hypothetical protein LMG28138_00022 [Pararobbsia alpina]